MASSQYEGSLPTDADKNYTTKHETNIVTSRSEEKLPTDTNNMLQYVLYIFHRVLFSTRA